MKQRRLLQTVVGQSQHARLRTPARIFNTQERQATPRLPRLHLRSPPTQLPHRQRTHKPQPLYATGQLVRFNVTPRYDKCLQLHGTRSLGNN